VPDADHQHAARDTPAELLELAGVAQKFDQFRTSSSPLRSRDIGELTVLVDSSSMRARLLPNENAPPRRRPHLRMKKHPHADQQQGIGTTTRKCSSGATAPPPAWRR